MVGCRNSANAGIRAGSGIPWSSYRGNFATLEGSDDGEPIDRYQSGTSFHWAVCEPAFDLQLHAALPWHRTQPVILLNRPLSIPPAEDLLFLLCIHGARHYRNCLKWLCDITQLIRTYRDLDWALLCRTADRFRQRRAVWIAVRLAHELLGIALPFGVRTLIDRDLDSFRRLRSICFRSSWQAPMS